MGRVSDHQEEIGHRPCPGTAAARVARSPRWRLWAGRGPRGRREPPLECVKKRAGPAGIWTVTVPPGTRTQYLTQQLAALSAPAIEAPASSRQPAMDVRDRPALAPRWPLPGGQALSRG